MSKHLLHVLSALLLPLPGIIANAASFDCKLAHNGLETMICADGAVSKLDEQLDAVYTELRKASNDEGREKATQLAWLKTRNACVDLACLRRAYESRITALQARMPVAPDSDVVRNVESPQAVEARNNAIKAVLGKLADAGDVRYDIGWFDLDGDGREEAIVLVTGADWCGTGGCTLMVLRQDADSWRVVSQTPGCRKPVVLSDGKTNGWRDLAVVSQGGGNLEQKMTVLKVKTHAYVKYPEMAPEHRRQTIIR